MNFRKVNNLAGWITGSIATLIYLLTMEATASFWDCGEFIACAYKLEIGHSPGAPFFLLIQRMFGILAGGNLKNVAICINSWSAIASGLTILFLFWTITRLARKLLAPAPDGNAGESGAAGDHDSAPTRLQTILIIGAGLTGALAFACSDTFWYSAVEAEVYATSSLLTALTFWAMLRWEAIATQRYADRWLLLIAYLMGVSVGIHLLVLLAIPALAMIYYFRRCKVTRAGTVIAFVLGCAALGLVQYGMIQGLPIMASAFDLFFVNSLGLPFDSGALFSVVLMAAVMAGLLIYARKKNWYLVHTGVLCLVFVMIGLSSYIVPMIRSRADVPVDMTNPDNAFSLVGYIQREMFGEQHLLYGQDFDAKLTDIGSNGDKYARIRKEGKDRYVVAGIKKKYNYEDDKKRLFPRIWGNTPEYDQFYRRYLSLDSNERPAAGDNMKFFFNYQLNWMWWRYFMWNYAGRQNDYEGQGEPKNGNWCSGLPAVDKALSLGTHNLGDLNQMADGYRNNAARNELYYLPLLLGILGIVYQAMCRRRDTLVIAVLFFFTGIAVAVYLNTAPMQSSERDYAFTGSFYTFAIWIGLGVLMVYQWLKRVIKSEGAAYTAVLLCLLLVPTWMAKEEWHDHDRSRKTLVRATAYNMLASCEKNALLFVYDDNELYPLWYLQEVEGIRTDVRVISYPLLLLDWYIDQLHFRINDAGAVPMVWKQKDYIGDLHDYIHYIDHDMASDVPAIPSDQFVPIGELCRFIISGNKTMDGGVMANYMPTRNILIPAPDKSALGMLAYGIDSSRISTDMRFSFSPDAQLFTKNDLAQLNIIAAIAAEGWKRPVYFSSLEETGKYGTLNDFMKLEGKVYRLVPFKLKKTITQQRVAGGDKGFVDIDKSLSLFTNAYIWGGGERRDVYFDEKNRLIFIPYRVNAVRIADELTVQNRKEDAIRLLDRVNKSITEQSYPYDYTALFVAQAYYHAGGIQQGSIIMKKVADNAEADINYLGTLNAPDADWLAHEAQQDVGMMNSIAREAIRAHDEPTTAYILQCLQNCMNSGVVPGDNISRLIQDLQAARKAQQP